MVHFSARVSNKDEMVGTNKKATFKESSMVHLLEIDEPGGGGLVIGHN